MAVVVVSSLKLVVVTLVLWCVAAARGASAEGEGASALIIESADRNVDVLSHVVKHVTTFKVRAREDAECQLLSGLQRREGKLESA